MEPGQPLSMSKWAAQQMQYRDHRRQLGLHRRQVGLLVDASLVGLHIEQMRLQRAKYQGSRPRHVPGHARQAQRGAGPAAHIGNELAMQAARDFINAEQR